MSETFAAGFVYLLLTYAALGFLLLSGFHNLPRAELWTSPRKIYRLFIFSSQTRNTQTFTLATIRELWLEDRASTLSLARSFASPEKSESCVAPSCRSHVVIGYRFSGTSN